MGLVPKQTKAENKGMFGMSMYKMIGLMLVISCSDYFGQDLVNRYLNVPFIIGCAVIYLLLGRPMPTNPKVMLWRGLLNFVTNARSPEHYASIIGYAYEESNRDKEAEPAQGSASASQGVKHEQDSKDQSHT